MEKKTLEDFLNEATRVMYGFKTFEQLDNYQGAVNAKLRVSHHAAELWGQYCREEGKKEVAKYIVDDYINDGMEQMITRDKCFYNYCTSILQGLKTTDSNKEE